MLVSNASLAAHANAIRKLGKQTVENVIEIGRHLAEAKAEVKKLGGAWGDWLKHEFKWSETQARNFTNVYDLTKSENATVANSDLPLKSLYLLAAPSTSKEARAEVAIRTKGGAKLKHKDVAAVVKKHKGKERKPVNGAAADIETAIKAAGTHGMTTDELKVKLGDKYHPQTINSTTNGLKHKDRIRWDGKTTRRGRAEGGRPGEVYVYNPDPKPKPKKKQGKQSAEVHNFSEHKLVAMIEDETICKTIEQWAKNKTPEQRALKAYRLVIPLVGDNRRGLAKMDDQRKKEFERTGRYIGTLELTMK